MSITGDALLTQWREQLAELAKQSEKSESYWSYTYYGLAIPQSILVSTQLALQSLSGSETVKTAIATLTMVLTSLLHISQSSKKRARYKQFCFDLKQMISYLEVQQVKGQYDLDALHQKIVQIMNSYPNTNVESAN